LTRKDLPIGWKRKPERGKELNGDRSDLESLQQRRTDEHVMQDGEGRATPRRELERDAKKKGRKEEKPSREVGTALKRKEAGKAVHFLLLARGH